MALKKNNPEILEWNANRHNLFLPNRLPARGLGLILQRLFAFSLALSVFVGVALYFRSPLPATAEVAGARPAAVEKLSAAAVLKIDPAANSNRRYARKAALPSVPVQAFLEARDWPGLYRQLAAAAPSAESHYLQAELLVTCAKRATATPAAREQQRIQFVAQLPRNDPNYDKRLAAWDQLNRDRCGDLSQIAYNEAEAYRLIAAAAEEGDLRARAWLLSRELQRAFQALSDRARADNTARPSGLAVSDQQFSQLVDMLSSQDPLVINELKEILASSIAGSSLRIGPNQETVDQASLYYALGLVACDFGAPCGQHSPQMLADCAANSHCDTGNLYDHTYYYGVPPYGAQLVEQYRTLLTQMIASHDFSQLTLQRGPTTVPGTTLYNIRHLP